MSLSGAYQTSKLGATAITAFNGSAGAAVRPDGPDGTSGALQAAETSTVALVPTSYAIRVTQPARILQGGSTVTVTATTGFMLAAGVYWRVDVESNDDRFLSVLGDTTTAGNIEVTRITRV